MDNVSVLIKKIASDLPLPRYQTELASGVDLHAAVEGEVVLNPGASMPIPTGVAIALPKGYEAQIRARSGLAFKNCISMVNGVGTIDADYRGEIKVILINHGREPFKVKRGDRVAQMIVNKLPTVTFQEVEHLDDTYRGEGGFGSTGK